eukprot:IDg7262t1
MLFAPIQAPRLTSISRKAIQYFLAERATYENAVAAQPGLKPISYANSFDATFLGSLICCRIFGIEVKEVSDLSDDIIKANIIKLSSGSKPVSAEEALADVKRNVRFDASEPDAKLRVLMLQASYIELCKKRGWKFYETAQKAAVKHIIAVLQPPQLKSRVEDALELDQHELKKDFFKFVNYLTDQAEICESFHPLRNYRAQKSKHSQLKTGAPSKDSKKGGVLYSSPDFTKKRSREDEHNQALDCLNPKCDGKHLVKDCPKTSPEMKKELLEAFRAKRKAGKDEAKVSALVTIAPATLSASTPIVVSDTIVKFLGDKGIFLPTVLLSNPQRMFSVDGSPVDVQGQVQLNPTLQTVAGPCRLRNIKAYIMPCGDTSIMAGAGCPGEIVLGNPVLVHSGLDVKDFIADNIERLSSLDYGDLFKEERPTKIGKLGVKLLTNDPMLFSLTSEDSELTYYDSRLCSLVSNGDFPLKDGDDVDYKDVEIGETTETDLNTALSEAVSRCSKSLPKHLREALHDLVLSFKDIFRIKIGADTPVDVPPMEIKFEALLAFLHGATNAVSYFRSSMESMFSHLDLLIWLDDMLGYASDAENFLSTSKLSLRSAMNEKCKIANRPLSAWGDEHDAAFKSLIQAIINQVTLATQDPSRRLCLFTDASSTHWAGVLTQVDPEEIKKGTKPPQEWNHSPVAFVSGSFRGASFRWSTPEQEAYAIIASVLRLSHILAACGEFSLFTDHKNILYMMSPTRFNSSVARHVVHKTQRWALRLAEFNFTIEHIPGRDNLWADVLTRWAARDNSEFPARRTAALRVPLITEDKPELPSLEAVASSQAKEPPSGNHGFTLTKDSDLDLWKNKKGQLYIPDKDEEIQLR